MELLVVLSVAGFLFMVGLLASFKAALCILRREASRLEREAQFAAKASAEVRR
ncbi:hypothetical protein [Stenotrophomonas sp. GZD-301]|uniref:hypothetical protein n=1 Tax=Stenotrophomonas sp. GZD-301 TaxID=3404814 RepID=UPI003BB70826